MGIQGLTKLLADNAPGALRAQKFDNFFGRKIAVDASMHIYAFLVVVGRSGDQMLTSETGEVTSHLLGMFYRTCRMLEAGMKPIFVFEGKAPEMKLRELAKRSARREGASAELAAALESGTVEEVEKYSKRTVRVTREHNEECKRLLRLMGVPVLEAPGEAEAQCAQLSREGAVYGVSTEDMDALTFGTARLVRNLMAPASQGAAITEFEYDKVLAELALTPAQFTDLCILCGCDYAEKIPGIGPVRALALIRKHGSLEKVLESLDPEKHKVPADFDYVNARKLFAEPNVLRGAEVPPLRFGAPDVDGLVQFLVREKSFDEKRVRAAVERIVAAKGKASQGRLESFFAAAPRPEGAAGAKRKAPPAAEAKGKGKGGGKAKKTGKAGGVGGGKK